MFPGSVGSVTPQFTRVGDRAAWKPTQTVVELCIRRRLDRCGGTPQVAGECGKPTDAGCGRAFVSTTEQAYALFDNPAWRSSVSTASTIFFASPKSICVLSL